MIYPVYPIYPSLAPLPRLPHIPLYPCGGVNEPLPLGQHVRGVELTNTLIANAAKQRAGALPAVVAAAAAPGLGAACNL